MQGSTHKGPHHEDPFAVHLRLHGACLEKVGHVLLTCVFAMAERHASSFSCRLKHYYVLDDCQMPLHCKGVGTSGHRHNVSATGMSSDYKPSMGVPIKESAHCKGKFSCCCKSPQDPADLISITAQEDASPDRLHLIPRSLYPTQLIITNPRDPNSPMSVTFTDFGTQCRDDLHTWIPRVSPVL